MQLRSTHRSRSARGFTLLEVVIAVAVLGLILASVPPVLLMITHAQFEWREQRVAEALTRNQVELIKVSDYIPGADPDYATVPADESYRVLLEILYPDPADGGLQEITITIEHADELVLETKTYKGKQGRLRTL